MARCYSRRAADVGAFIAGHGALLFTTGLARDQAVKRGRPRRHARLPADRRRREHRRVVALVGPCGRSVLAGLADRRDRSRGSRGGDRRRWPWRRAARGDRTTALSQHCPCGARVPKRLAERVHRCPACQLRGDRDAVAAVLASFVVFTAPGEPSSARVDYAAAANASMQHRILSLAMRCSAHCRPHHVRQDAPLHDPLIGRRSGSDGRHSAAG
jgi:hypothetical protein